MQAIENKAKIVTTASQGYNYNYASLGDIARAGYQIPLMRIKPTELGEFIEYKDDAGEWQIGAKIVIPQMAKSNDAQMYGAAVTYARRVTAQLALGIVCSDDEKVETQNQEQAEANEKHNKTRMSFDEMRTKLDSLKTIAEVNAFAKEVSSVYLNPTDKQRAVITTMFNSRREQIVEARSTYSASN